MADGGGDGKAVDNNEGQLPTEQKRESRVSEGQAGGSIGWSDWLWALGFGLWLLDRPGWLSIDGTDCLID